jgi:hypothetical protein
MKETKDKRQKTKDSWILKTSLFLITLIAFSACKTTKTLSKRVLKGENPVAQVIAQVQKTQPQFETADVSKMSLALEMTGRKVNVSASCKIRSDSAIFISFQIFGFEIYKAELMPDSIKVFDKMNRRYYAVDYSYFSNRFGVDVDFFSLQSLLTARFFCIGSKQILTDSCKLVALSGGLNKIDFENKNMHQSTEISPLNLLNQVLIKAKNTDYQLQIKYSDYTQINGVNFPQEIDLQAGNQKTKALCNFSILKVEFNTNIKFQPTGSERYIHGDIDQILKK